MFKKVYIIIIVLFSNITFSQVVLNELFQNNMVLQRNCPIAIFGKATSEKYVEILFKEKNYKAKVENGLWKLFLDESEAGGPFILTIIGKNKIVLENILVGEVWVCSGQSNMEMPLKGNLNQPIYGSNLEILKSKNPSLRLFKVAKNHSLTPINEFSGEWNEANPNTVKDFSATAYFYGKLLQETLGVPIGLINSSVGGTPVEAWTPKEITDVYFKSTKELNNNTKTSHKNPNVLYNAMIHPLIPYSIRGVIWYQGEANKDRAKEYEELFPAMINSWRELWNLGNFPFYFVQVAPLGWGGEVWAEIREAQLNSMKKTPNTGMVVTLDIGQKDCIHPPFKKEVGERLAFWALAKTYGFKGIDYSGPMFKSMKVEANKAIINFDYATNGLTSMGKELDNFVIAGEDRVFYKANTTILKTGGLEVFSDQVAKPTAVRYAWEGWVEGSLFNIAGLPASSFRTDNW